MFINFPKNQGITLIETLIYIALFILLIGGAMISAFYIIDSSENNKSDLSSTTEAQFLLRKIDWALTDSTITSPSGGSSGSTLEVNKSGLGSVEISFDSNRVQISHGGSTEYLTAERVLIENLSFTHFLTQGTRPAAIETSFTANGKNFEMIKYLRK